MMPTPTLYPHLLLTQLAKQVSQHWAPANFLPLTTLVAVSGGADSVALLRLLHYFYRPQNFSHQEDFSLNAPIVAPIASGAKRAAESRAGDLRRLGDLRGDLVVAHWNHKLRGAASELDQQFIEVTCQSLGLRCVVGSATTAGGQVSEESLRQQRYDFLEKTAHAIGARYVAVAHTADDTIETVLHQLFRGTGPAGLAGIPMFRPLGAEAVIARPLLGVRRAELRKLLTAIGQPWRHDQSNDMSHWKRNWIRNELLPTITSQYPQAEAAILRAVTAQAALVDDLKQQSAELAEGLFSPVGDDQRLEIRPPTGRPPASSVLVMALANAWDQRGWARGGMTQQHWENLVHMITPESLTRSPGAALESLNLPGNLRATRLGEGLVVVERLRRD